MTLLDQAHICISLHRVIAFLGDKLLELFLVTRGAKLVSLGQLQSLSDDLLVISELWNI